MMRETWQPLATRAMHLETVMPDVFPGAHKFWAFCRPVNKHQARRFRATEGSSKDTIVIRVQQNKGQSHISNCQLGKPHTVPRCDTRSPPYRLADSCIHALLIFQPNRPRYPVPTIRPSRTYLSILFEGCRASSPGKNPRTGVSFDPSLMLGRGHLYRGCSTKWTVAFQQWFCCLKVLLHRRTTCCCYTSTSHSSKRKNVSFPT